MSVIIELKKKPLPAQAAKLEILANLMELVEDIEKKNDIEKLKKSQTVRIKSKSGKEYVFTITLI
jgi:hypothetical protein